MKIICNTCKSENVARDANAAWDVNLQQWVLSAVFDQAFCNDCDSETTLEEVQE